MSKAPPSHGASGGAPAPPPPPGGTSRSSPPKQPQQQSAASGRSATPTRGGPPPKAAAPAADPAASKGPTPPPPPGGRGSSTPPGKTAASTPPSPPMGKSATPPRAPTPSSSASGTKRAPPPSAPAQQASSPPSSIPPPAPGKSRTPSPSNATTTTTTTAVPKRQQSPARSVNPASSTAAPRPAAPVPVKSIPPPSGTSPVSVTPAAPANAAVAPKMSPPKAKKSPARPAAGKASAVPSPAATGPAAASASAVGATLTAPPPQASAAPVAGPAVSAAPKGQPNVGVSIGPIGSIPTTAEDGTVPSARVVVAADKDVLEDWRERNISGDVPFNVSVKTFVERLLTLRLKWGSTPLEGLVVVETTGSDFVSLTPVPEVVMPIGYTPKELGWEPGKIYFAWLQRAGKHDEPTPTREQLYKQRLRRFYQYYAPSKEKEVDAILTDFEGSEDLLFSKLTGMYGPEPTEQQLRRRKAQLSGEAASAFGSAARTTPQLSAADAPGSAAATVPPPVPAASLDDKSDIGKTVRELQLQHLKETGKYQAMRDEVNFKPDRPSEVQRVPVVRSGVAGGRGGGLLGSLSLRSGDGDAHHGALFANPALQSTVTHVMGRLNESLLLAVYYKRWSLWRAQRCQQKRICIFLRGNFDAVLRRDYYLRWRSLLQTKRMRRQVQQSTQLAAKSESLVGDLATENSYLKGEIKRLRTQVEMLDNNNARRLESLYSSAELAVGQIRTLTAENHQREELIVQLEQRLMNVGNLMLQANDEKERVIEASTADRLQLETERDQLQEKVNLLEDALQGAKKQLEAWKPKPPPASCVHCPHYFELDREIDVLHKNADVLRARIRDLEKDKATLRETSNSLAKQLHQAFRGGGTATDNTTAILHQGQYGSGVSAPTAPFESSGGGSARRVPPRRMRDRSPSPDDYLNNGSRASSTSSPPPPPPEDEEYDVDDSGGGGGESTAGSFAGPPVGHSHFAAPQKAPQKLDSGAGVVPPGTSRSLVELMHTSSLHYALPSALEVPAPSQQGPTRGAAAAPPTATATAPAAPRTLAESFAQQYPSQPQPRSLAERWAAGAVIPGSSRTFEQAPPPGDAALRTHVDPNNARTPTYIGNSRYDSPAAAAAAVPYSAPTGLSLGTFFQSEERRMDERLRMSMDRQMHPRLRTSGFSTTHGTLQPDVQSRFDAANSDVLRPVLATDPSAVSGDSRSGVFALASATQGNASTLLQPRVSTSSSNMLPQEIAAARYAAASEYLLRGVAPHERPKSVMSRNASETNVEKRFADVPPPNPSEMRRSIFAGGLKF